jgi:hypothetical protein
MKLHDIVESDNRLWRRRNLSAAIGTSHHICS